VKKKSLFDPIREELMVLIIRIDFMESQQGIEELKNLHALLEIIATTTKKCDLYLKYQIRNHEWN
jgi:hypothetical protein